MSSKSYIWRTAYSAADIDSIAAYAKRLLETNPKGIHFAVGPPKTKRSVDQNALSHVWYQQVSEEEREYTAEEVKRLCKLHFAIPILRRDPEFSEMMGKILDPLDYEDKVRAMDFLPASSLMTRPQMSQYLEHIQAYYADRVKLEFP